LALQNKKTALSGSFKKAFLIAVKTAVSSALIYLVVSNTGFDKIISALSSINIFSFVLAALIYIVSIYLSAIRWRLLLPEGQRKGQLFSLYLIGSFFNHLLPGVIGGDAVKAYYLSSELKRSNELRVTSKEDSANSLLKTRYSSLPPDSSLVTRHSSLSIAIASVFMDRYIGFAALMFIGLAAFPFGLRYVRGSYIEWALPLIAFLFVIGSFIVFGLKLGQRFRLLSVLYSHFSLYLNQKAVILKAFLISVALQVLGISAVYVISIGLKIHVPIVMFFIFIPVIAAVITVPISISGIGVREASFVLLFGTLGLSPAQATAVSFTWFLSIIVGSLAGFVEYLRYKKAAISVTE
jgi:uncharacterized membrane protein YbhN (UPF0104 family)